MKKTLLLSSILLLGGCAGVTVVENQDDTFTASSNSGTSLNGGWDYASREAQEAGAGSASHRVPVYKRAARC